MFSTACKWDGRQPRQRDPSSYRSAWLYRSYMCVWYAGNRDDSKTCSSNLVQWYSLTATCNGYCGAQFLDRRLTRRWSDCSLQCLRKNNQKKIKQITDEEQKRSRAEASTETQLMSLNIIQDITCVWVLWKSDDDYIAQTMAWTQNKATDDIAILCQYSSTNMMVSTRQVTFGSAGSPAHCWTVHPLCWARTLSIQRQQVNTLGL